MPGRRLALMGRVRPEFRTLHPSTLADIAGLYVPRSGEGAEAIYALLTAGLDQPIALFGPAGSGKSTELAALAERVEGMGVCPLARLDKFLTYGDATSVTDALDTAAILVVQEAVEKLKLSLSPQLLALAERPWSPSTMLALPFRGFDLLLAAIREIRVMRPFMALLVDGIEKAPANLATGVLSALARFRDEVHVVVVVPLSVATGPDAAVLHDYRVLSVGPIIVNREIHQSVTPDECEKGVSFLIAIARRRLGMPPAEIMSGADLTPILRQCALLSGGLVRTFLQLVQNAALQASMGGHGLPDRDDVVKAARDQASFLMRLLKHGDLEALRSAHGKNGLEVDIERRVRFLANGLLLEYQSPGGPVVRIPPLLAEAVLGTSYA